MSQETKLLKSIQQQIYRGSPQTVVPIGDDGFVFTPWNDHLIVTSQDMLMQDVHFTLEHFSASDIGYKALHVNLSDLVAMGAAPQWAQVSLALPHIDSSWVQGFYDGMLEAAQSCAIEIVGGDLIRSSGPIVIDINVIGKTQHPLRRSHLQIGDSVMVSGPLGDAAAGLEILQTKTPIKNPIKDKSQRFLINKQKRPTARLDLLDFLQNPYHSCQGLTDISDSLIQESLSLIEINKKGLCIDADLIPISNELKLWCETVQIDPLQYLLRGGENYELLGFIPPEKVSLWESKGWTRIGSVVAKPDLILLRQKQPISWNESPSWDHWGPSQNKT